jgi:hypothetical protein
METYYTYYSYEEFGRGYIGYRKCLEGVSPGDDFYLGSYKDKTFKPTSKVILTLHKTKEEAISAEIKIQRFFKVVENPHFVNKSYQKSIGFSFAASGENHPMFGKNHTERSRRKISEARSGKKLSKTHIEKITGKKNHRYKPTDWYHSIHGEILQVSLSDLAKMFPDQNLDTSSLSKVIKGKLLQTKGWYLLKNKGIDNKNGIRRDWCHSSYGLVQNTSAADLVKRYPKDKLSPSGLSHLVVGRANSYKGWVFIDRNNIDTSLSKDQLDKIFSREYPINRINKSKEKTREKMKNRNYPASVIKDWYHPNHGVVRSMSIPDLVKKYTKEYKLSRSLLYLVVWGKRNHHKGWTIYKVSSGQEGGSTDREPHVL